MISKLGFSVLEGSYAPLHSINGLIYTGELREKKAVLQLLHSKYRVSKRVNGSKHA